MPPQVYYDIKIENIGLWESIKAIRIRFFIKPSNWTVAYIYFIVE